MSRIQEISEEGFPEGIGGVPGGEKCNSLGREGARGTKSYLAYFSSVLKSGDIAWLGSRSSCRDGSVGLVLSHLILNGCRDRPLKHINS